MIKFLDLEKINSLHKEGLLEASQRVISSGWYLMGNELKTFETKLASIQVLSMQLE